MFYNYSVCAEVLNFSSAENSLPTATTVRKQRNISLNFRALLLMLHNENAYTEKESHLVTNPYIFAPF